MLQADFYKRLQGKSIAELEYDLALQRLCIEGRLLAIKLKVIELCEKAGFKPDQPRIPAGSPRGGQWTDGGTGFGANESIGDTASTLFGDAENDNLSVPESWNSPETFLRHAGDHGADFNAISPKDYATKAEKFRIRAINEKLPAIEYNTGEIGIYDPKTNSFGLYTKEGKTITYYKPTSPSYFERESTDVVKRGGRVINPIPPRSTGGTAGIGSNLIHNPKAPKIIDEEIE